MYSYIKRVKTRNKIYRYLVVECYLGNGKRKKLLHIPIKKILEDYIDEELRSEIANWCGGWDLNPRRPTPTGLKPVLAVDGDNGSIVLDHSEPVSVLKKRVGISFSQKLQAVFLDWCIRKASPEVCKGYVKRLIEIDKGEKDVEHSRWHITAYKKLMKYLCEKRENKRACSEFKKVKSRKSNPDNYIPPDDVIKEALVAPDPLGYFYYILVQSGLRAIEAARLLHQPRDCVDLGGYYRCPILWKRGAKQALWAYLIELPRQIPVTIEELHDMRYTLKTIQFKYVRKWVTTKMLLSGMQEIAVDFAQGRVPDSVLRRHYADRLVITDREYRKYAAWLRQWLTSVSQASLLSTTSRQS